MPSVKYVVGAGTLLDWALASWAEAEPDTQLRRVDVGQAANYDFDLSRLAEVDADGGATAFVAWNSQFLNFRRLELMGELKGRGLKMPPLLCPGALVSPSATVGENTVVSPGAVVAPQCRIGFNCFIGAGSHIGFSARVDASAWIGEASLIGARARIGANTILGRRSSVADGVQVGRYSVLEHATPVTADVPAKTFYLPGFRNPVVVIDGSA